MSSHQNLTIDRLSHTSDPLINVINATKQVDSES